MPDVTVTWLDGLKEVYEADFVTVEDGILRLIRHTAQNVNIIDHEYNIIDYEYNIPVEHVRIWKEE